MTSDKPPPIVAANKPLSPVVLDRLREILGEAYHVSRDATIYSEVVTGEINYKGMGELRDVLEHLQRSINTDNEEDALNDLTEAYEHLRRAGVESVQGAASKVYFDALKTINTPSLALKVACLEVPDKGKVRDLRMNAMKNIVEGRSNKADKDKWVLSIRNFTTTIDSCYKLQDMFPSSAEVKYRLFNIAFGIITILSLLIAIYAYFYK